jgi:hypothetical protein
MKPHKSILLLLAVMLAMQGAFAQQSRLTLSDNYPSVSEKVKITYAPTGALLADKNDISAQVFFLDGKDFPAVDVNLTDSGQKLIGEFTIPATAKAFFVKVFSNADIDNNDGKGYLFPVYKNKKPVAGAYESEAFVLASDIGANYAKIKQDNAAAIALYKKEHDIYPEAEKLYEFNYYYLMGQKPDQACKLILADKAKAFEKSNKEAELHLAACIYDWLGKKASADSLNNIIKTKFPNGETVTNEIVYTILREKETRKMDWLYKDFMVKYPDSKNPNLDFILTRIAAGYLAAGNNEAFEKYLPLIQNKLSLAGYYNSIAYEWAVADTNLKQAEKLSGQALEIVLENQKHPLPRPFYSPRAMEQLCTDLYNMYADSYAYILYRQKRYNEALNYQKEVYAYDKRHRLTVVEHYALILNQLSKYDESKTVIESFLKSGKSNDVLYNELKRAYVGLNRSEVGFDKYFDATSKQSMN